MQNVAIDKALGPGIRITVAMGTDRDLSTGSSSLYSTAYYDLVHCFISIEPITFDSINIFCNWLLITSLIYI